MGTLGRRARRFNHRLCESAPLSKNSDEYLPILYFISLIMKDKKEVYEPVVDIVTEIIENSGLREDALVLLDKSIQKLIRHQYIRPIQDAREDDLIRGCKTPIEYDVDRVIQLNYDINPKFGILQVNLYRILLAAKVPILTEFLNRLVLAKYDEDGTPHIKKEVMKAVNSTRKVHFLMSVAELSKLETQYLYARYRIEYCSPIEKILDYFDILETDFIAEILDVKENDIRKILKQNGKIRSYGFVLEDNFLSPDLLDCINNNSLDPYFSEYLKPIDCTDAYDTSSFSVPKKTTEIMKNLLVHQDSSSILLYGKPGSGKTEYAKSLAKLTGYNVFIYKNENEITSGMNAVARLNCYLSIKQKDTIVIVDEADKLLQTISLSFFGATPTPTKGTVNQMLENNKNKIIWIINHTQQIDESTKRRFTMSYKFDSMPLSMLTSITKSKLAPLCLSKKLEEDILSLFTKYSVTGSSVDNIVKTIKAFKETDSLDDDIYHSVETVIQENAKLLTKTKTSKVRDTVSSSYNPSVINASLNPDKIVKMVENAERFSRDNKSTENGIRMLFYGISGSGKTELVRYIAQKLGKGILIKRPSDILGKYVGDNEGNIKDAFDQAAQENKILLFDEADTFFSDRKNASQSWERSTTNEFLTQMEEFPGILICTSNLKQIMDPAMARRFHIMVEFKPMEEEGIKTLLNNYFTNYEFTQSQLNELSDLGSVTPGDFGALSSRIRFLDPDDITSDYIVDELVKLQEDKDYEDSSCHTIGFSTF